MQTWKFDHIKLKQVLKDEGRTTAWVATNVGIQRQTLYLLLSGKKQPSLPVARMICRVLNIDESKLIKQKAS